MDFHNLLMQRAMYGGDSVGGKVQTDWNQTDSSAADFIKNKTHYETKKVILEEQELPFVPDMGSLVGTVSVPIENGDTLHITFDGVDYECTATFNIALEMYIFGNLALLGSDINTGEPFLGAYAGDMTVMFLVMDEANHAVKIVGVGIVKLPEKYLTKRRFYIMDENENWLYTDASCKTKATISDIPNHSDFEIGMTGMGVVIRWDKPISVDSDDVGTAIGYKRVVAPVAMTASGIFEMTTYYTAEYTPE